MKKILPLSVVVMALAFVLTGCSSGNSKAQQVQDQGQALTEQAYSAQSHAVPYPAGQLTNSQERTNLRKKLLLQNDPNHIGYVYILSFGKFIGYYTIKGKVSSTDSQMTPSTFVEHHSSDRGGNVTYPAPGDDGSYGANEPGVFFFTTAGALVQVSTDYIYSDQPITVGNIPQLTK